MTLQLPEFADDGLMTAEINSWGEEKYRLVWNYASIFATSMKRKWHCRVYVDLFAGAGRSRIKRTRRIVSASPLLALNIADRFDKYIFSDIDSLKLEALKTRVSIRLPNSSHRIPARRCQQLDRQILDQIPKGRRGFKVLTFCFVDPYKLENLAFDTIRDLSVRFMGLLGSHPLWHGRKSK